MKIIIGNSAADEIKENASRLFPINKLLESTDSNNKRKRFYVSTVQESISKLSEDSDRFLIITSELLRDGSGIELIKAAKIINRKSTSLLILTHNHKIDITKAFDSGVDALILDESIDNRSGALINALESLKRKSLFLDPALT